jgi:hypothetical protein
MSCLKYCLCVVQNKFICKAIHWFFLVLSNDNVLAVIVRKNTFGHVVFWWVEISKEVNFELSCWVFLCRELRRSQITLYKDCDSILLSCIFSSNQKCLTVEGDSADWACAMPCDQSVCRVSFAFTG